ncbi:hypothetical protein [Ekhidna sp.]|uniref:hypothetical protein n=1 Tax=Ekhidna sp. TaxID=2608089 RepID=UPI00351845BD
MTHLKSILIVFIFISSFHLSYIAKSQSYVAVNIEEEYEFLTKHWMQMSEDISHYYGLSAFCDNSEYRTYTIEVLEQLHHYDSIMLDILKDPTADIDISSHEYKKTMKDIEKFEGDYDLKAFISFLRESCMTRNELEKDKEKLKKEVGMYSYDGQVMMLEAEVNKYLKKIDKRILAINKHIHHIHPDKVKPFKMVSSSN